MGIMRMVKCKLVTVILVGVIVLSLGSTQLPWSNAFPDIIYSDSSDGSVSNTGSVSNMEITSVGDSSTNSYSRTFFKFSLAGISRLTSSAVLNIYLESSWRDSVHDTTSPLTNPNRGDIIVYHIADYGTLDAGDFYAPSIGNDPGIILSNTATPNIGYISIDVTAGVNDDLIEGRTWSTFMISSAPGWTTDGSFDSDIWRFYTVQRSGTSQDPYIEYVTGSSQIGDVAPAVFHESPNTVHFIYGDYNRLVGTFASYDATASGFLYGLCDNDQTILFDSDSNVVAQPPATNYGEVLLDDKCVVVVGGPIPNWVVDYYERTGQSPVRYNGRYGFETQGGTPLKNITDPLSNDWDHHDIFLVETFNDDRGNFVVIIYGIGWKGTFAGGVYFKEVISNNMASYTDDVYIFEWTDAGIGDGIPQKGEIAQVYPTP
jgi:hypothetical protein